MMECFICYIKDKSENRHFYDTFTYGNSTLVIMKKQETLQLLLVTNNNRNKQTIKEKDYGKNKKETDPQVNKIVSCRKKLKKCFMCYTKLTCVHVTLNRRSI